MERAPAPAPIEETPPTEHHRAGSADVGPCQRPRDLAAGAPLARAQVRLTPSSGEPLAAESDDDGRFDVPDVPFGAATLDAQAKGYTSAHRDLTVDAAVAAVAIALDPAIRPRKSAGWCATSPASPWPRRSSSSRSGAGRPPCRPTGASECEVKPGAYDVVDRGQGLLPRGERKVMRPSPRA